MSENKELFKYPIVNPNVFFPGPAEEELVLCLPNNIVSSLLGAHPEGFHSPVMVSRDMIGIDHTILMATKAVYRPLWVPRPEAEEREDIKQIIPYCVFTFNTRQSSLDERLSIKQPSENLVFTYRRTKKSGEKRLVGNMSIGVGGHINPPTRSMVQSPDLLGLLQPMSFYSLYMQSLIREIHEEVILSSRVAHKCVGVLYDPTTPVGRVHLGIVHRFHLEMPYLQIKEDHLKDENFQEVSDLVRAVKEEMKDETEPWTKIVLDNVHLLWD